MLSLTSQIYLWRSFETSQMSVWSTRHGGRVGRADVSSVGRTRTVNERQSRKDMYVFWYAKGILQIYTGTPQIEDTGTQLSTLGVV